MAVTPMDLQVLFMQEKNAANRASREKRFPKEVRNRISRQTVAQSLRENVDAADSARGKEIDEEGSQGSPNYFARRQPRHRNEEESNDQGSREDGKGAQIDLRI
ncbi:MAG: hypothetical protein ABEK50_09805 [bacterium]